MELYSGYINKLIEQFSKLPGVGSKSAQRLAFYVLGLPKAKADNLVKAIIDAKEKEVMTV